MSKKSPYPFQWGFDKLYFDDAKDFRRVLKRHRLNSYQPYKVILNPIQKFGYTIYRWSTSSGDVKLCTSNNPITGASGIDSQSQQSAQGLAHYAGIVSKSVSKGKKLLKDIRVSSSYEGESRNSLQFIHCK